ncbi:hypothetical protein CALCODRAFT_496429 [Calocera cornea HHB12733]|uniref:Uncharacterized protein n=1 Tax=Calocera cornea HHB12733 TaxID=1353952 RepID=A0A165FS85_9BASI|nr:hypothetical protein CALCODRAFT_496429 [Calocera cornea HHB12733]
MTSESPSHVDPLTLPFAPIPLSTSPNYTPFPTPAERHLIARFASVSEGPAETTPGSQTMHGDVPEAYRSIARLTRMEMEDNVMCVLAHETEVAQELGSRGGTNGRRGVGRRGKRRENTLSPSWSE